METNAPNFNTLNEAQNFDPLKYFTNKELCYYKTVHKYFKVCNPSYIEKMIKIINGTSTISLRVLDWFVTRHSKKRLDIEVMNSVGAFESFDVHISYKAQLKSYKKRYFDPFRRRRKFPYFYDKTDKSKYLVTTIGQLNFFKWAISHNIIEFVEKNVNQIIRNMNQSNKEEKKKKDKIKKIKKKEMETAKIPLSESTESFYSGSDTETETTESCSDNKSNDSKIEDKDLAQDKFIKKEPNKLKVKKQTINFQATKSLTDSELELVLTFN